MRPMYPSKWWMKKINERDEHIVELQNIINDLPLNVHALDNRRALTAIRLYLSYSGANSAKEIRDTVIRLIPADLGPKP